MQKKALLVLSAKSYNFQDEKQNNKVIQGMKLTFIDLGDEVPAHVHGHIVAEVNMPYEEFNTFRQGAGLYECTPELVLTTKKPTVKLTNFEFKKSLDLGQMLLASK